MHTRHATRRLVFADEVAIDGVGLKTIREFYE